MNPFFGVVLHWLGGFASGSFYVPFRGVRKWSWETYWLVGGIFAWIICPWVLAALMTRGLGGVLLQQSAGTLGWTYFFGALWGLGGLTYGLTIRYLGLSLGTAVALGYCAAFGTLLPPVFKEFVPAIPAPETISQIFSTMAGRVTLAGVALCLVGIAITALAGLTKEREMAAEDKARAIAEFNFRKGILVATFCGLMSACFAFALLAANPIASASAAAGTTTIWTGLPKLAIVLLGGFTTNFVWCALLNIKNRTGYQYFAARVRPEHAPLKDRNGAAASGDPAAPRPDSDFVVPRRANYLFCALAGTTWYFQFFFYTMGETQMGRYGFASWTLHMASIIIFSTMWGWIFHEWKGSSRKAHLYIFSGVLTLIVSTVVIGLGAWLKVKGPGG